jgi:hypothetical protein
VRETDNANVVVSHSLTQWTDLTTCPGRGLGGGRRTPWPSREQTQSELKHECEVSVGGLLVNQSVGLELSTAYGLR